MSAGPRRRRALLLLAVALACGGLAASEVASRVGEVESRVGRPVPVLVAARHVDAGERLRRPDLALARVPERFVPPGALSAAGEAVGVETAAALPPGSYVTTAVLGRQSERAGAAGASLRGGERAVELAVAGGAALAQGAAPGARVDVVVSTEPREGEGRSFLALESVELVGLRAAGDPGEGAGAARDGGGAGGAGSALATLRVSARQAVYLTAAQSFAREVRLLPRPPGDRRRVGRASYAAGGL